MVSRETSRPPSRVQLETLVAYVEEGLTIDELAHERGVSPSAIEQRLTACRRRLGAVTTAQAYAIALQRGLLAEHAISE